jgi:hypothetical protein
VGKTDGEERMKMMMTSESWSSERKAKVSLLHIGVLQPITIE